MPRPDRPSECRCTLSRPRRGATGPRASSLDTLQPKTRTPLSDTGPSKSSNVAAKRRRGTLPAHGVANRSPEDWHDGYSLGVGELSLLPAR